MAQIDPRYEQYQRRRWLRPNAHLYMRPDAQRFLRPDAGGSFKSGACDAAPPSSRRESWTSPVGPRSACDEAADALRALRWDLAMLRFKWAWERLERAQRKAYNPDQPRVPKHNPGGGQWTREGGAGIGHNQGPPLEPPPVPPEKPRTAQARNTFIKAAAQWLARAARMGTPIGGFLAALDAASWLDTDRPYIEAFRDPPKSLEELQDAVSRPARGYHVHHIVEQTPAGQDGFPRDLIDGRDNRVRIPALKHWQITGWYATRSERFGGKSPREYLRGRSWRVRTRVGREALIEFGVLKP